MILITSTRCYGSCQKYENYEMKNFNIYSQESFIRLRDRKVLIRQESKFVSCDICNWNSATQINVLLFFFQKFIGSVESNPLKLLFDIKKKPNLSVAFEKLNFLNVENPTFRNLISFQKINFERKELFI